jgi:hypothetical protein
MQRSGPTIETLKYFRENAGRKAFEDLLQEGDPRPKDPRGGYVGANRCADCHIAVATQHAGSPHGTPTRAVVEGSFAGNTQCVSCHTTAPYWQGGWGGPADRGAYAAVSCESCHGPGEAHATAPAKGWGKVPWARCVECHAPDRTANFDPEAAWKRFGHALK